MGAKRSRGKRKRRSTNPRASSALVAYSRDDAGQLHESFKVYPMRHVSLRGVRAGDPRIQEFWRLQGVWLPHHRGASLTATRRELAAIARRLGLKPPRVTETPASASGFTIATPEPISIHPDDILRGTEGKIFKRLGEVLRKRASGAPMRWREYDLVKGESKIVMRALSLPNRPEQTDRARRPGRPKHPLHAEILADIQDRPYRTDNERARDLTARLKSAKPISSSTVRRVRLGL